MILFAVSDKGGTGRSVTSSNLLYRAALNGRDTCYVDFDFGSPTVGAIFGVDALNRGTASDRGLHMYLQGKVDEPESCDLWTSSDRSSLRNRPPGAGRMVLLPGDRGGAEFVLDRHIVHRCGQLFQRLQEEFALSIVDLSAGRSYAVHMALAVTAGPDAAVPIQDTRWLVFHRWTMQHILAAHGLVHGGRGILDTAVQLGHDPASVMDRLRFVRTALVDPNTADLSGLRPSQISWLRERHRDLQTLAAELDLGRTVLLGSVPMDPILQWHEQILTDRDLYSRQVANAATVQALEELSRRLFDPTAWDRL